MKTISCFQINLIRRAALAALNTFTINSLGYMGGGVGSSTDFVTNYFYNNVCRDTRGFTAIGTGGTPATLDVNGLPTGPSSLVMNTPPSAGVSGPVAPGSYYLNVYSVGQTVTAAMNAASGMTLGTGVPQGDGVCVRYPVTVALGTAGSQTINFSGAMSQLPDMARDGSVTAVGQPEFASAALTHYAKFATLRLMDYLGTNTRTDVAWTDRPAEFDIRAYKSGGSPFAWGTMVKFINAVASQAGSKLRNVLINIPYNVDTSYAPALSAYLTAQGLTSAVQIYVQLSNEHWNTSFTTWGAYQTLAIAELQYLTNYGIGSPTISSVTSDGTNLTFTTVSPIGSYLTTTAPCVVVGNVGGFNVGTLASPVTATKTGSNTFTVPSTGSAGTGQFGVIFNLSSTLLGDGVLPTISGTKGCNYKWFIRKMFQLQQQWVVNRPQDKWFFDAQLYGGETAGTGGNASSPIEFDYAAWLGGGSASSWVDSAAIGWYVTAASNSTVNAVFTDLNNKLNTTYDGYVRGHVYQCKKYGLHPIAYECGPDTQNIPALQSAVATDARMQTFTTAMMDKWFSNGGEIFCWYYVSPAPFVDGNTQGGWPALQSYADVTSPKFAALMAYLPSTISYANINSGSPVGLTTYFQLASSREALSGGLLGWFDNSTPCFVDVTIPIPVAGSYQLTVVGCVGTAPATIDIHKDPTNLADGTLIGTSTLPVVTGGWNAGATSANAAAVSNPVTTTLAAGVHTIRFSNPSAVGQHGIGLYQLQVTAL